MHIHVYTCMYVCMYIHICIHVCIYIYIYIYICLSLYTYIYIYIYIFLSLSLYIYIYIYMYIYIYIDVFTWIQAAVNRGGHPIDTGWTSTKGEGFPSATGPEHFSGELCGQELGSSQTLGHDYAT